MQEKSEKNFFHPKNPQTQESMNLAPEKFLASKNQCISLQKKKFQDKNQCISQQKKNWNARINASRPRKKIPTQESLHPASEKFF